MKLVLLALVLGVSSHAAAPPVTLYSSEPAHLWNRLYAALLVRSTADGVVHDDLLDPPFWWQTKYLREGESNRRAVTLLGEFAADREGLAAMSPIQRAVMQRDLLGVFCWLMAGSGEQARGRVAEPRVLASALARAIRHVALSTEEVGRLPDNYATAVALPEAPTSFFPGDPERPFLPKDLLIADGSWIAVESQGDDSLPATVHFKAFHGRSAFEVFFRHPEGRAAGEAYLAQLAAMPNPWLSEKPERAIFLANRDPAIGPWVNPATPQFPIGSMWALLRRAVLVSPDGKPVVSPIVESIQVRVYMAIAAGAQRAQRFFEWELRRALLLGRGGFQSIAPGEEKFGHFLTHEIDPFEALIAPPHRAERPATLRCYACHTGEGIHSVVSRSRLFEVPLARPPEFRATDRARTVVHTESAARQLPVWHLLQRTIGEK